MILKNCKELKQDDFKSEKELQTYFENNLSSILNIKYIDTEFSVGNFRIDTLAYDEEFKAFKIIEYKNVKNHSLVDQGYTYLKLLLERKADFVLQYSLKTGKKLNPKDVDWSQSRIIFVSPVFTQYQLNATDFKNIPVDLIKITKYEGDIVDIDFIKKASDVKIEEVSSNLIASEVNKEIKVYTEEDHLKRKSNNIIELYEELKERILELDDIFVDVKKQYIAFKGIRNIVDIEIHNKKLLLLINLRKGSLEDPLNIARDVSGIGHWGNGDYSVDILNSDDIDKVIPLIKQSVKINKK